MGQKARMVLDVRIGVQECMQPTNKKPAVTVGRMTAHRQLGWAGVALRTNMRQYLNSAQELRKRSTIV